MFGVLGRMIWIGAALAAPEPFLGQELSEKVGECCPPFGNGGAARCGRLSRGTILQWGSMLPGLLISLGV